MVEEGIGEGGVDPEHHMGVQLPVLGIGIGWRRVLDEVGDAIAEKHHEKEGFPLVIVVICWVEKKLDVVVDASIEDGIAGRGVKEEGAGAVEGVVELCSFEKMKGLEVNKKGSAGAYHAMPRDSFFRKGVAGDWVNHMTPEMARRLDEIVADKLHAVGLAFHEGRLD